MDNDLLNQAIQAIKGGDKVRGSRILADLLKREPRNETAWFWLATCVQSDEQKIFCLQKVIDINPNNEKAKNALNKIQFIEEPPLEEIVPMMSNQRSVLQPDIEEKKIDEQPIIQNQKKNTNPEINHGSPKKRKNEKFLSSIGTGKFLKIAIPTLIIMIIACVLILIFSNNSIAPAPILIPTSISISIPTLSQEQEYVRKIDPVLTDVNKWLDSFFDYGKIMDRIAPGEEITNRSLLSLFLDGLNKGYSGELMLSWQQKLRLEVLPSARQMKSNGYLLISRMEAINPPPQIKVSHDQIVSCINVTMAFYGSVEASIETGSYFSPPSDSPCNLMDDAMKQLSDFIAKYK